MVWSRCLIAPKWLTSFPCCVYLLDWMPKYPWLLSILFPLLCLLFWKIILVARVLWYLSVSGSTRPPRLFFVLEIHWLLHREGNLKIFTEKRKIHFQDLLYIIPTLWCFVIVLTLELKLERTEVFMVKEITYLTVLSFTYI